MSSPRYDWWSYVKGMIRRYPELEARYRDLHRPQITAVISAAPGGRGDDRKLERLAIRELPVTQQREYEAVRQAIQVTRRYRNGKERLTVVRYVFWGGHKGRRLLSEAAEKTHYSYDSVKKFHREFILLVASFYGLLDDSKYTPESQKDMLK